MDRNQTQLPSTLYLPVTIIYIPPSQPPCFHLQTVLCLASNTMAISSRQPRLYN